LERIPSSVVIHKRVDSSDTRLLQQTTELKDNPLGHYPLGFFDFGKYFGKYHMAVNDANFAFEKVGDMLAYDIDSNDESDDDALQEDNEETNNAISNVNPKENHNVDADAEIDRSVATAMLDTTVPATEYQLRWDLVKDVKKSKDKLFIIRRA
jgi:hypothetical protein